MQTKRLTLRRFSPEDWQDLLEYLSDEEVVKFEPYKAFTREQARQAAIDRSRSADFWAVCLSDTQKLIGNIYLAEQGWATWELGYVFNRAYQGKGYATEAARALMAHLFSGGAAHRIVAMCDPQNTPSWKLLERLKMRREGHLLKNVWFFKDESGNPIWKDTYEYAILRDEWKESAP